MFLLYSSTNRLGPSEESFRQSISQTPGILSASITTGIPSGSAFGDSYVPEPEGVEETVKRSILIRLWLMNHLFPHWALN
jgi:hypothetical protein